FDPDWEAGCPACSLAADNIGHLAHLHARNTSLAFISRAPLSKLLNYKERMGWDIPWYSSNGSNFNYDFHATLDESVTPIEYNYMNKDELIQKGDRKSTRLNSSHVSILYAVFCLKKKRLHCI